jgi:hypothetical protein
MLDPGRVLIDGGAWPGWLAAAAAGTTLPGRLPAWWAAALMRVLLLLACATGGVAAAGPAAGIRGHWAATPQFTPTCVNGIFENTPQLPSRTFACSSSTAAPPPFHHPATPIQDLPPYTKDPRRDHHHVVDGPVIGNGNVGVAIGGGNLWNVSRPWIDLFISTNSFWALSGANHTQGKPFRGRLALPGTMLLGVARLSLPAAFAGASFSAEQDLDSASATVNLTSAQGQTVSVTLFVSPRAPLLHTTIRSPSEVVVTLNTTVLDHFWHRDPNINTSFPVATSATCRPASGSGSGQGGIGAVVTRASDFVRATDSHCALHLLVAHCGALNTTNVWLSRRSAATWQ